MTPSWARGEEIAPSALVDDTVDISTLEGAPEASELAEQQEQFDLPTAGLTTSAHTVEVAVIATAGSNGSTSYVNDAGVRAIVDGAETYWKSQSNGQITAVDITVSIKRYVSTTACGQQLEAWQEAAGKFGRPDAVDYVNTPALHLLVLAPVSCGGGGRGTVGTNHSGTSTVNGGVMWVSYQDPESLGSRATAADALAQNVGVVAHEMGHNLGLQHSNAHLCPVDITEGLYDPSTDSYSNGCSDEEYGDGYDVMSGVAANAGALNVTQKQRLGVLATGEMQQLSLAAGKASSATTTTLVSTGQTSGRRAIAATDPLTGKVYYIDYRGGGGQDAKALYATGFYENLNRGVRLLSLGNADESLVFRSPTLSGTSGRHLYVTTGQSLTSQSGGVKVTVKSIASGVATVTVTLSTLAPGVSEVVPRLDGADRFEASASISRASFTPGVATAYVAGGLNFPDALSGAPVAAQSGSPILLVAPGSVPASIATELDRLNPGRIVVLGGASSVSEAVQTHLATYTTGGVTRLAGADRFAASADISAKNFESGVPVVYVTNGLNFPDALAGAPVAAKDGAPILLVTPGSVPDSIATELDRLNPGRIVVLGGVNSVSESVQAALKVFTAGTVTRLAGADRFAASADISEKNFAANAAVVYVTNGLNFPDALSGASVAGRDGAPILLVTPGSIPASIATELKRLNPAKIVILGGVNSVSSAVQNELALYTRDY